VLFSSVKAGVQNIIPETRDLPLFLRLFLVGTQSRSGTQSSSGAHILHSKGVRSLINGNALLYQIFLAVSLLAFGEGNSVGLERRDPSIVRPQQSP
jgi:hypothetical protein